MVLCATAIALPGGARYLGKTDTGRAVSVRLNGDASRVKRMRIHYDVTCDNGHAAQTYTDILNPRVHKDGTFKASGTYTGSGDGSKNDFKVAGKITSKKATGTFSLTATTSTVHCKTGKLTWTANRAK